MSDPIEKELKALAASKALREDMRAVAQREADSNRMATARAIDEYLAFLTAASQMVKGVPQQPRKRPFREWNMKL